MPPPSVPIHRSAVLLRRRRPCTVSHGFSASTTEKAHPGINCGKRAWYSAVPVSMVLRSHFLIPVGEALFAIFDQERLSKAICGVVSDRLCAILLQVETCIFYRRWLQGNGHGHRDSSSAVFERSPLTLWRSPSEGRLRRIGQSRQGGQLEDSPVGGVLC